MSKAKTIAPEKALALLAATKAKLVTSAEPTVTCGLCQQPLETTYGRHSKRFAVYHSRRWDCPLSGKFSPRIADREQAREAGREFFQGRAA